MPATPTRPKKRLGRFMRRLREDAGVKLAEAAAHLHTTDSSVSRYETGLNRPQWPTVAQLLRFYGADDESATALALWEAAGAPTTRVQLPQGTPKNFRELVRVEQEAALMRTIAPSVVPGLLQTADYARAVHASAQRSRDPDANVDDFVAARLSRQQLLDAKDPLAVHAVLDEIAVRRLVGGADVMRGQLEHLVRVVEKPNVTVQVVTAEAGEYGGMSGACSILSYDDPEDLPVAYLEHAAGGVWVEDRDDVQHLSTMFDGVAAAALSPTETVEFIRKQGRDL